MKTMIGDNQPVRHKCYATKVTGTSTVSKNIGLKIVLWLPYIMTMLYFTVGLIVLLIRYDIPPNEIGYISFFIVFYGGFLELSISLRRKYWPLTKL